MKHDDHRTAETFEFHEDRHLAVFICKRVSEGAAILHVSHEAEGDWQFLCGGAHEEDGDDGGLLVCLEHMVARDPSLNQLAGMCSGFHADRASADDRWIITDEHEEFIRHHVKETGWSVQGVEKDDADDELPEFAYTIGLYQSYQQPEIIIVGLSLPTMSALLNICGDKVKAGEQLPLDAPVPGVLPGYQVRFRAVRDPATYAEYFGYATWFYSGPEFPVIQLVWPDKAGRFHDDPTAGPGLHERQPLLP